MKKILIINTVGYNYDGITSVILNYIQHMDRCDLSISFLVYQNIPAPIKRELENLGILLTVSNRKQALPAYVKELFRIMCLGYDTIHIHGNSGTMSIEAVLAKLCRVKNIIVHAHSTSTNHPIANSLLKYPMMFCANHLVACSDAAGKWLYGNRKYCVLNNAIDVAKFQFNNALRINYRTEFDVGDAFLIGHIGHFTTQKNHFFLIDTFMQFHNQSPNSKLLLIGTGADFEHVQEAVNHAGLSEAVIFAGQRSDVAGIYNAMDQFILPSKWEGLPLTMIEAQANGLPVLASDVITKDAVCSNQVFYKPLSDGPASWADTMVKIQESKLQRNCNASHDIEQTGFDIRAEANKLRKIYLD